MFQLSGKARFSRFPLKKFYNIDYSSTISISSQFSLSLSMFASAISLALHEEDTLRMAAGRSRDHHSDLCQTSSGGIFPLSVENWDKTKKIWNVKNRFLKQNGTTKS